MRILLAEFIKTKRTSIPWLIFFMPIVVSLCILGYLIIRSNISTDFIYEGFITVWTGMFFPILIGLFSGLIINEESLAGNFNGLLNNSISRWKIFLGKFFTVLIFITITSIIATGVLTLGMSIFVPNGGNFSMFFLSIFSAILGSLPIIIISLVLSFALNMGASIGMGICGVIMAILIGSTSLGNNIWYYCPWAWPVKMSFYPYMYFNSSIDTLKLVTSQYILTISISLIVFIVLLALSIIWFNRWEGRKAN